uniref:Uncharacterized protein n=1 Tax=Nelumbo nucifera TaxID=4432 RepID=A0A822Z3I6_NELNU|nr:TPA_asm: hypothetical protein HUJ06_008187 [Nelumbo nucifera]
MHETWCQSILSKLAYLSISAMLQDLDCLWCYRDRQKEYNISGFIRKGDLHVRNVTPDQGLFLQGIK